MSRDPGGELVDVLDDAGRPVVTVTRREMRARRLPHRATYILVFNRRGELFVHLRSPQKDVFPEHWDVAVGGVLAAGESFDEGARREAREELGVDLEPEPLFPLRYADERTVVHGMVYRARHEAPSASSARRSCAASSSLWPRSRRGPGASRSAPTAWPPWPSIAAAGRPRAISAAPFLDTAGNAFL